MVKPFSSAIACERDIVAHDIGWVAFQRGSHGRLEPVACLWVF
jgi:hypothetical protein